MTTQFFNSVNVNLVCASYADLPSGAMLAVRLEDVSMADAGSVTLAESRMLCAGSFPTTSHLHYDSRSLTGNRYALSARIELNGKLLFINTTHHTFDPEAPEEIVTITLDYVMRATDGVHGGNLIDKQTPGIHGGNLIDKQTPGIHGGNLIDKQTPGIHGGNRMD